MSISRRSVLKASALFALVPLAPKLLSAAEQKEHMDKVMSKASEMKYVSSLVENGEVITGAHWGILKATIKHGKIVSSIGLNDSKEKVKNPLQHVVGDQVYAKSRIKYPMVRKSYLKDPHNSKPELRGKDEWVRVSYKKAIELIASAVKETREKKGPEAIFAGSYGWKSSGNMHNCVVLLQRYMSMGGGFTGITADYSTGAAQVMLPHVVGTLEVYNQQTVFPVVMENSKVVVIWGANPMVTLRIAYSISEGSGLEFFNDLKNSNKKIILIDPIKSDTVQFFMDRKNSTWITPIPNTDVALMLGIMHTMYTTNKYDKKFLDTYTTGFDKFLDYMLGKTDGVVKDAKWANSICGIDEKTIKDLAKTMFENRTMIMAGWGMQRAHHGEQPHWMLVTLASMIGQIGLPGGGFGFSYHYANGGNPAAKAAVIGGMNVGKATSGGAAWLQKASAVNIPVSKIADCLANPGKVIDANGGKVKYPDIDLIYWVGGNPIGHHQNINNYVKVWQKPSHVIVHDPFWTATARHADIVMPTTTSYERDDISMSGDYSNLNIVPMKALVKRQHEAKDDYEVFSDLAKEAGFHEQYTEGKTPREWIEQFYNTALKSGTPQGIKMPDFKTFWDKNMPITFEVPEEDKTYVRYADFRDDPILNSLGTPSGRIEIYSETVAKMNYDDCRGYPSWFEPAEWLGMKNKPAEFHLLSPHPEYRLHSQLANTSLRNKYAVSDKEPIWINEEDAKAKGIKNGDVVRVFNARGEVLAGAVVGKHVRKGVLKLSEGAWYNPDSKGLCKNGCANVLTMDISTSKLANGNCPNTALVNIEKYKGKVEKVDIFEEPKNMREFRI
ncbi:molybdopterin guanine dinucleotide-containing S/N-oxide reductase [Helicobacter sp. 11S02629-2]|uniref:molybdopterin guanine dinucleotide-containing S/N-oxide reductase n=1 Tax=Helicobacter sp. 11S02629-2 TaxID=1476195 RepID=UPI000BA6063B|nr:molybdopterin guanine dinucleotide-containing S/N-oxide reductase [Helicobacter sp. 11S02629-2]PAF45455.1 trimethylamine N-oxide reductase I catalytic subunit [Helicobacter sp. 11S02629-2]